MELKRGTVARSIAGHDKGRFMAVLSEMEKGRGTQFDPQIADVMIELIKNDTDYTMHE